MRIRRFLAVFIASCIVGVAGFVTSAAADPVPPLVEVPLSVVDEWVWYDAHDDTLKPGGLEHLVWSESGGGDYQDLLACDSGYVFMCDLFPEGAPIITADMAGTYPTGSKGTWTYTVPGGPDTFMKIGYGSALNVTSEDEFVSDPGEPHAFVGIWNGTSWTEYDETNDTAGIVALTVDGTSADRQIRFGLEADSAPSMSYDHWAAMGTIGVSLADEVEPTFEYDEESIPAGWVNENPIEFPYEATDGGLGIKYTLMVGSRRGVTPWESGDAYVEQWDPDCVGNSDDPCPLESPVNQKFTIETAELPEGESGIQMTALDAAGNYTAENPAVEFDIKVDTIKPSIDLAGSFTTAPGMVLNGPLYSLDSDAADGTTLEPNSGVNKIEVLIDDVVIDSDIQSCTTQNCPLGLDTDIEPDNYTNGDHVLKVKATDAVGHVKTETVEFEVDR